MCDEGDGSATVLDRRFLVARKAHRCIGCNETIAAGERYHIDVCAWEGTVDRFKHCARCWAMIEALWKRNRDNGEGYLAVDFTLDCGEVWRSPPDDVAALAFALPQDFANEGTR